MTYQLKYDEEFIPFSSTMRWSPMVNYSHKKCVEPISTGEEKRLDEYSVYFQRETKSSINSTISHEIILTLDIKAMERERE